MILLEMKYPQLSKPEATAAKNENSIGDRMQKKPWEKPGSVGGPVPLRPDESVFGLGKRVHLGLIFNAGYCCHCRVGWEGMKCPGLFM